MGTTNLIVVSHIITPTTYYHKCLYRERVGIDD